jgi:hypothetical protein
MKGCFGFRFIGPGGHGADMIVITPANKERDKQTGLGAAILNAASRSDNVSPTEWKSVIVGIMNRSSVLENS